MFIILGTQPVTHCGASQGPGTLMGTRSTAKRDNQRGDSPQASGARRGEHRPWCLRNSRRINLVR